MQKKVANKFILFVIYLFVCNKLSLFDEEAPTTYSSTAEISSKTLELQKRTMTSFRMELHEKNALARTFYPKYTTYTGDGSGRDGYVVFGNGG